MPRSVRLLLSGRDAPVGAWLAAPEWAGLFRVMRLGPLTERESMACLAAHGVATARARRLSLVARGHPLSLVMAAQLGQNAPDLKPEDAAAGALIDTLAAEYLAAVPDTLTREALEAASVIRRVTAPLLGAMLPDAVPGDTLDRIRGLAFVEQAGDGLFVHDAIRDAIATSLRASDPDRHRRYRIAAWNVLREGVARAGHEDLWRYTADILYLLQNPVIREGFFPSGYQPLAVEPATPDDRSTIRTIAERYESPAAAEVIAAWWQFHPRAFFSCRDANGRTPGFAIVLRGNALSEDIIAADPVAASWSSAMRESGGADQSLLIRRLLDVDEGEGNSGSRGAFGLDVKRTYMEMRPGLRYIYLGGTEPEHLAWCAPLRFASLGEPIDIGGVAFHSRRLDMGPGSVDSWLAQVVADELGIGGDEGPREIIDDDTHELVLAGGRVALTPLEFGLLRELRARAGRPVSRADLVESVWGYRSDATSNVVEAVVLGLRRKLGDRADLVETVRGVGYRFRQPPMTPQK
jgi:hypothetical protein